MKWTLDYNIHIITVIHSNFYNSKATGHLGSFLEKKTETQISVECSDVNNNIVIVDCKRSRGVPFDKFAFEVRQGLPIVIDNLEEFNNSPF